MIAAGDDLLTNKVFFHNDKTDRFEVVVADVDGRFHTVEEIALELGEELDVVYWEGDRDVFGPGLVYVWAECGVALIAIPPEMIPSMDDSPPQLAVPENTQLKIRHPIPLQSATLMEPDIRDIVMIKVLFAPTSYNSFKEAYWGKMPYEVGRWKKFFLRLEDK
jgi:hypothetical protein